jgi:hypothetical protein
MRGRMKEGISAFFAFSAVKFLSSLFWLRPCRARIFVVNEIKMIIDVTHTEA